VIRMSYVARQRVFYILSLSRARNDSNSPALSFLVVAVPAEPFYGDSRSRIRLCSRSVASPSSREISRRVVSSCRRVVVSSIRRSGGLNYSPAGESPQRGNRSRPREDLTIAPFTGKTSTKGGSRRYYPSRD